MAYTSSAVKRRYNEKAYDRIFLSIPKGKKEEWTKIAEDSGMSLTAFVREAVEDKIAKRQQVVFKRQQVFFKRQQVVDIKKDR